jgi:hypothetical protein
LLSNLVGFDFTPPLEIQAFVPALSSTLVQISNSTTPSTTSGIKTFAVSAKFQTPDSIGRVGARYIQTLGVRFVHPTGLAVGQTYRPDNETVQVTLFYQKNEVNRDSLIGYIGRGGKIRIDSITGGVMTVSLTDVQMTPHLPNVLGRFALKAIVKIPYK